MTDSGPDADNSEVRKFCESRGIKSFMCRRIRPGQAGSSGDEQDFVNKVGGVECPGLGEGEYDAKAVPENWPTHLDEAIRCLNRRILPFLKFSLNELLLRLVLSTPSTPIYIARGAVTSEVSLPSAYVSQQWLDG